jgi:fermentation-respiration switch protein FrsA (DUF1100 family)
MQMSETSVETRTFNHERFEIRPRGGGPPVRGDVRFLSGTTPRTAVLLCHGFKGFREWGFFPPLARAIASRGHAAVSFDLSRNGVGEDGVDFSALHLFAEHTHTRNLAEIAGVLAAVRAGRLLPRAPRAIGMFGHSRGGGEAILTAAEDGDIDALVTWAAIAQVDRWQPEQIAAWERGETVEIMNTRTGQAMPVNASFWNDVGANLDRLDVVAAAGRLDVPWLIVHGDADTSVPVDDAHRLFAAAGEEAELLIVEGADHTFGAVQPYAGPTPALRTAAEATLDWFDDVLEPDPVD